MYRKDLPLIFEIVGSYVIGVQLEGQEVANRIIASLARSSGKLQLFKIC